MASRVMQHASCKVASRMKFFQCSTAIYDTRFSLARLKLTSIEPIIRKERINSHENVDNGKIIDGRP